MSTDFGHKHSAKFHDKYINESEASSITGLSKSLLQHMRWQHKGIPYYKISKKVLYKLSEVIDYMEQHRIEAEV